MTYATKIKKLRDEMLLTQEEFGEILGVSLATVNRKLRELFKEYKIDEEDR